MRTSPTPFGSSRSGRVFFASPACNGAAAPIGVPTSICLFSSTCTCSFVRNDRLFNTTAGLRAWNARMTCLRQAHHSIRPMQKLYADFLFQLADLDAEGKMGRMSVGRMLGY